MFDAVNQPAQGKNVAFIQQGIEPGQLSLFLPSCRVLFVGQVYVEDLQVNRQLVGEGMAWVYLEYMEDKSLLQVEQAARTANRGLWGLPSAEQVPPGEWRRRKGTSAASAGEGESGGRASATARK